jgi:hypothetical protein
VRFLDPDAGEMLDRLSVLARKRLEKPQREHFAEEEAALIAHWGERLITRDLLAPLLRLAAANAAIWQTEDDIRFFRLHRDEGLPEVERHLAFYAERLQAQNEERARMVQFFNEKLGMGSRDEKDFEL